MIYRLINNKKKEILFLILLLIIFYRSPYILLHGRFMAEEGSKYFANAYKYGFYYSFFFVDFNSGYLNLWANISGIIANTSTLKLAPFISNYLALVPKLLIFYFILYKDSYFIDKFQYYISLERYFHWTKNQKIMKFDFFLKILIFSNVSRRNLFLKK